MAVLLRGGMLAQADGYPAEMRATSDLLRRRLHLLHTRAELFAHSQKTTRQDTRPDIGQKIADQAHRAGVAERCPEPAVHKSLAVNLALIDYDDERLRDGALPLLNAATQHEANPLDLWHTVPGLGTILRLVRLDEIYDINRCPRVQEFASDCRLVTCATESHGHRAGSSGTNIGTAPLTWAVSEAAVLCLREHPAGQQLLAR